ncbi:MAG TPA: ABC transporter permease, partial [Gemmatimonadaceae bacterium]|nr:ABC transporter permease [Gemmatimonadaceae bacterium]
MPRIPGIRRLMRLDRDTAGLQRAVDDELHFHFEMTTRELMANGMSPEAANREARRRFGDVQSTRERLTTIDQARTVHERRTEWWSAFAQDLRYAVRGLRLKPWFAAAVIATLGLGIGANAAMFSIVDRLLFRPPQFLIAPDRASRLYVPTTHRGKEIVSTGIGYRRYLDLRTMTKSFDAMTPFYRNAYPVGSGDATRTMSIGISGADLWKLFDVKPVIGRFFTAEEDTPPVGARVVVLSYAFWQTQFGGRSSALGSSIDIGQWKFTIIGVAPEGFSGFADSPVSGFVPISAVSSEIFNGRFPWYSSYAISWFDAFARRRPGVTVAAANADLTAAFQQSYRLELTANPKSTKFEIAKPRAFAGPVLLDRGPNESSEAKVATWLIGVTAVVLLIACANVGNLLLARALRRRREIAVRIALGVSRGRLLLQLLTESVLLAVLGGAAGLLIAQWGGSVMRKTLLDKNDVAPSTFTDGRLLLVVAILAIVAGLLTGLAPALQTGRGDIAAALKAGTREGTVQRSRLRATLLVMQAALSVVLLIGAGLFVRSLVNVKNVHMGYDVDRLLWVSSRLRGVKLDSVRYVQLQEQLRDRAEHVPGVEHAARALTAPFWSYWSFNLYVDGIDSVAKLGDFTAQAATPEFFATTGTRVLRGRGITTDDREQAPRVIVVGESMAKRLWPGEDAIGKCVRVEADTTPCASVVGIAEDVRLESVSETQMHYYMPLAQFHPYNTGTGIFVRARGPANTRADEVRRALQPLMPGTAYVTVTPMSTMVAPQIRSWTVGATMFTIFGVLALVLAAVGLYSVIAYNVAQRTHEMGVRIALGAQSRDVVKLIVREGLRIAVPGVVLGAAIALVAGRWVAPLLFQVSPKDPPVMATVIVVLVGVAILASWLPAARAARVDPIQALRAD